MKVGGLSVGPKRASEIIRDYPAVSEQMVNLKPDEQEIILRLMDTGRSEAEILALFTPVAPAGAGDGS
jgi:hypothetical protein